jgi:stearoyl-CoA desaturase (delta-9 desaturase)
VIHLGALAAPFVFSWQGVVALFVLHWMTGGLGVCLGYHRLLTHRSFKTYRPIRYLLAAIAGLAGEGTSLYWVSDHRKHHAHSDQVGDPHSPHDGPWWSHVFWTMAKKTRRDQQDHFRRWVPDLMQDPGLRFLHYMFLPLHFALGLTLMALGYWLGGWYMAWSLVVWGMFLRLTLVLHSTWFVNSASHMWGYRNYETTDDSRNNWWVALISYGEGWHNNHHAFPTLAAHGHRWWEVDVTYLTIRLMKALGLAWDVVERRSPEKETPAA